MTGQLKGVMCAVSAFALFACGPAVHAQTNRPWVDPPSRTEPRSSADPAPENETVTYPATPLAGQSSSKQSAPTESDQPETEKARIQTPVAKQDTPAAKPQSQRKVAARSTTRASSTSQASSPRSLRQARALPERRIGPEVSNRLETARLDRQNMPRRYDRNRRYQTIQEGLDAGLEVMRLQTIELPDGRRIRVLTRPDPATMSELLAPPY
jgi:hypothetical protein